MDKVDIVYHIYVCEACMFFSIDCNINEYHIGIPCDRGKVGDIS